jgi:hypothetical protein
VKYRASPRRCATSSRATRVEPAGTGLGDEIGEDLLRRSPRGAILTAEREFENGSAFSPGHSREGAVHEVSKSVERLFYYAAWADKYDGYVHSVGMRRRSCSAQSVRTARRVLAACSGASNIGAVHRLWWRQADEPIFLIATRRFRTELPALFAFSWLAESGQACLLSLNKTDV